MTASDDLAEALAERVRRAGEGRTPLKIVGGATKAFYGRRTDGELLEVAGHRGVTAYEPTELVITARAGTLLAEIETLLAGHGQQLAFEPPIFGQFSTLGGAIAAGLSGARRPFAGAARDCLLGATILDGQGRRLAFGGQVFKNVAGFDLFRPMAGALGRLGVILEASIRLAPAPRAVASLGFDMAWPTAQAWLTELLRRPLPISGAVHLDERLILRLEGGEAAVAEAAADLGGETGLASVWDELRRFRLGVLTAPRLWRLSVPRAARIDGLGGCWLINWAGAERWLETDAPPEAVRAAARAVKGHATLFRGARAGEAVFEPLAPEVFALHRRLAAALDPAGVLNPGRMYEGL